MVYLIKNLLFYKYFDKYINLFQVLTYQANHLQNEIFHIILFYNHTLLPALIFNTNLVVDNKFYIFYLVYFFYLLIISLSLQYYRVNLKHNQ
jgi:hypothetical protein